MRMPNDKRSGRHRDSTTLRRYLAGGSGRMASAGWTSTGQCQREVVETALHVEGRSEAATVHPEDSEAPGVRKHLAGSNRVNVFRGERDANDGQLSAPTV